jgi:hypothetical protein
MSLKLTKLEAARRQLATAIELWFHDKDQVSIHALSFAAYEIIHAVSAKQGRTQDLLFDSSLVKNRNKNEYNNFVKKFANFFKHAKHDPHGTIEFQPDISELFITFAILGLNTVGISANKYELAFTWWLCLNHPEVLTQHGHDILAKGLPVDTVNEIRSMSKSEFLDVFLQT